MHGRWTCFVINLDRSPERLSRIAASLGRLAIPFQRFAGIEGRDIDPDASPDFCRAEYERRHGKKPMPCEIGCFLSHLGVMRAFLQTSARFCLVLEDDAIPGDDLPDVLEGLGQAEEEWNIALLYGNYPGLAQPLRRLSARHELVGYLARQTGAVAYAIDRKAAAAYLNHLLPMSMPLDVDFDRVWDFRIKFRGVAPFPVKTGGFPSDIGRIGAKFPWHGRLQTYAARSLNELCRYRHYAFSDPIWLSAWRYRLSERRKPLWPQPPQPVRSSG